MEVPHAIKSRSKTIVEAYTALKRSGSEYVGLCPIHREKTPSFFFNEEKGVWHCFGCGKGGDAISLIMEVERLAFVDALQVAARITGVKIEQDKKQDDHLLAFAKFCYSHVAKVAEYLKSRGIDGATAKRFLLGYFPQEDQRYREFSKFAGRIIFPFRDSTGRVVGFGARAMNGEMPKYTNSSNSQIFRKSEALYGLYEAKKSIINSQNAYLVEGYFDVLCLSKAGIANVVAACGTSFTKEQARMLRHFTQKVTIMFDGDAPGREATVKAAKVALDAGMIVDVVALPDGKDPADLAASGEIHSLIKPVSIIDYMLSGPLSIEEEMARRTALAEMIASIEDDTVRKIYQGRYSPSGVVISASYNDLMAAYIIQYSGTEFENGTKFDEWVMKNIYPVADDTMKMIIRGEYDPAKYSELVTMPLSEDDFYTVWMQYLINRYTAMLMTTKDVNEAIKFSKIISKLKTELNHGQLVG